MTQTEKTPTAEPHPLFKYLRSAGTVSFLLALSAMVIGVYFWAAFAIFLVAVFLTLIDYENDPWVRERRLARAIGYLCAGMLIFAIVRYVAFLPAPLEIAARYTGGFYDPGTNVGGIKWQDRYSEVRVDIVNRSDFDYEDVDINVSPDNPNVGVAELGQFTNVPGVYFIPHNFTGSVTLTKNKTGFSQVFSSRVAPSHRGQRVRCDRFARHDLIEVVVALVSLHDRAKPKPSGLRITGHYTTLGGRIRKIKRYCKLNSLP